MAQPTVFTLDSTHYADDSYVIVDWDYTPSANHTSYRVYRDNSGTGDSWSKIYETTGTTSVYNDYHAPAKTIQYAVVEVTNGTNEEAKTNAETITLSTEGHYWLIHPTDTSKNVLLSHVTGDSFADEYEQEVMKLIGRGRKVDQGDNWGKQGTLDGRIYDQPGKTARQQRLDLEALKATQTYFNLKNPFGDIWKVALGDISFRRIPGTGTSEFTEITISYFEVA